MVLTVNSINQLISVMVKCGVLFEVRNEFLNLYRRSPDYAVVPFLKVLRNPNFAEVEIVTVIYVRTYACLCVFALLRKKEIVKSGRTDKNSLQAQKTNIKKNNINLHFGNLCALWNNLRKSSRA
jgi:hypothetical protein